jgi:hypothetical protein
MINYYTAKSPLQQELKGGKSVWQFLTLLLSLDQVFDLQEWIYLDGRNSTLNCKSSKVVCDLLTNSE